MTQNKGGDVLASGGVRCQFPPAGGNVSQERWDEIWKDYIPEPTKIEKKSKSTS